MGKRIAIGLDNDVWLVLHLMIAGRLHWRKPGAPLAGRNALAAFDFPAGSLVLTEAGSQRRASLQLARGEAGLSALDPGGIDALTADLAAFAATLTSGEPHTEAGAHRSHLFSGIGNAYSDEILHRAHAFAAGSDAQAEADEIARLHEATRAILLEWIGRLRAEAAGRFPEKVTAFRPEMAVHGKYKEPCPVCGTKVARIRYASQRDQLLPALPDRRASARRPRALPIAG